MKRLLSILIFLTGASSLFAQGFYILKVNRVEKMWVIPPDRRTFIGSRGIQKFDYLRPIPGEKSGENYIVTWRYRGKESESPLSLRFEYRATLDQKKKYAEKFTYKGLKRGTYRWTFKNVGPGFAGRGKVERWKVSLVCDGKIVAEKRSATWHAMEGT